MQIMAQAHARGITTHYMENNFTPTMRMITTNYSRVKTGSVALATT